MGYHFAVQVMWPSRHTRAPKEFIFDSLPQEQLPPLEVHPLTVWSPHDTLDIGHVTRIQKLNIPHIAEGIGDRERAGICFAVSSAVAEQEAPEEEEEEEDPEEELEDEEDDDDGE